MKKPTFTTSNLVNLINGVKSDAISVADRTFLYGDGVFTTIKILDGKPQLFEAHLKRLQRDSTCLQLHFDEAVLREDVKQIVPANGDYILRITVSRGEGQRGYAPPDQPQTTRILSLFSFEPKNRFPEGLHLTVSEYRLPINPPLAGCKHCNRLDQVLAAQQKLDATADEAVVLDSEDNVVEGISSNIFAYLDGHWLSPLIDKAGVSGVMRGQIFELLAKKGRSIKECRVSLSDLERATELFMTNAVMGMVPVGRFQQRTWSRFPEFDKLKLDLGGFC